MKRKSNNWLGPVLLIVALCTIGALIKVDRMPTDPYPRTELDLLTERVDRIEIDIYGACHKCRVCHGNGITGCPACHGEGR